MTSSDEPPVGTVFPPRNLADIAAYDEIEIQQGYLDMVAGDPRPGPNSSPGYRWGAQNRIRDQQATDDGFDALRRAYLAARRRLH